MVFRLRFARYTFRINPDGGLRTDMVVEMVQRKDVEFDSANGKLGSFPMRGGVTLIVSKPTVDENPNLKENARAAIRFVIPKQLHGSEGVLRAARQRTYAQHLGLLEGNDPGRFEIDHVVPILRGGQTALENLARLCRWHHAQKTHHGWTLRGSPGNWIWESPSAGDRGS